MTKKQILKAEQDSGKLKSPYKKYDIYQNSRVYEGMDFSVIQEPQSYKEYLHESDIWVNFNA